MDGGLPLSVDEVKGRNTWIVWTGGDDRFWDTISVSSFGNFDLLKILSAQSRSASSIAHELGLKRADVEDDLRHMIRSARAAGHHVVIEPARCRACGFTFGDDKLSKPGKCPQCRSTWLYEAQVHVSSTNVEPDDDV